MQLVLNQVLKTALVRHQLYVILADFSGDRLFVMGAYTGDSRQSFVLDTGSNVEISRVEAVFERPTVECMHSQV